MGFAPGDRRRDRAAATVPQHDYQGCAEVVRAVLDNLDVNSVPAAEWLKVFAEGNDAVRRTIAVSARLAEYRKVRGQLEGLICEGDEVAEGKLQRLLADNPWLFGSEYSELLSRRNWTRDQKLDFMLRRTADDYLEIIEIKTPFKQPVPPSGPILRFSSFQGGG